MDSANYQDPHQQPEPDSYQSCLETCGSIGGCLRAWLPCICFFCPYPYSIIEQSSIGLVERFGKYYRTVEPGLNEINPCTEQVTQVDLRTKVIDLARQIILTKDNIQINIDTCLYYRIIDPIKAQYRVDNLVNSLKEMAYAALRQICGEHTLQELLDHRAEIQDNIEIYLDQKTSNWGVFVDEIFIKDMILSNEMQSDISLAAKNKRIAQSKVISAKADVESAKLMREAADFLDNKAAMQIRFLETLQLIAKGPNPKIMFLPLGADSTAGGG